MREKIELSSYSGECSPGRLREECAAILAGMESPVLLTDEVLTNLGRYLQLLVKWNTVMNLVGPGDWRVLLHTLVADSFHLVPFIRMLSLGTHPYCMDLGAGAGLPGIPLRMLWQEGEYILVEAREKRALFLRTVLASCPLPGVSVFGGRAEALLQTGPSPRLVISRAFMPWQKVLELVKDHIAGSGAVVFLTLEPLPGAIPPGWTAEVHGEYMVPGAVRHLWALRREPDRP